MRCSFVQFGDVHLGTQQYDSPERLWGHVISTHAAAAIRHARGFDPEKFSLMKVTERS